MVLDICKLLVKSGVVRPIQLTYSQTRFHARNPRYRGIYPGHKKPFVPTVTKPPWLLRRLQYAQRPTPPTSDRPLPEPMLSCSDDAPLQEIQNPYASERRQCVLCKYNVDIDYKNSRLLSQFVSSFSGRIYDKNITGLCQYQQDRVYKAIELSRRAGYMPIYYKNPRFLKDPRLFDPMRPIKAHPF